MIDVTRMAMKLARDEISHHRGCAVVIWGVKSAFSLAHWEWLKNSLTKMLVPATYLSLSKVTSRKRLFGIIWMRDLGTVRLRQEHHKAQCWLLLCGA